VAGVGPPDDISAHFAGTVGGLGAGEVQRHLLTEADAAATLARGRQVGGVRSAVICRATDSGSAQPTIHSW
jgi:hypothetical protein